MVHENEHNNDKLGRMLNYEKGMMLTYQEAVTGPEKEKWLAAIQEEK